MSITEIVRRYIDGEEGLVAFRCRSKAEAERFFEVVKEIVDLRYHVYLNTKVSQFGSLGYEREICYRVERTLGKLDYGHDRAEYYLGCGRRIIDVKNIFKPIDYGEFSIGFENKADAVNMIFEGLYK